MLENNFMRNHRWLWLYVPVFWIILPAGLIMSGIGLESILGFGQFESRAILIIGLIITVPASSLLFLSVYQFKKLSGVFPVSATPPDKIIQRGLFGIWRHPVYLFYALTFLGVGLILQSKVMSLIVLPVFYCAILIYLKLEERGLIKRFGRQYMAYKRRTALIFPRLPVILRIPVYLISRFLFHHRIVNRHFIPDPPFFVIANHRNFLDPFFISMFMPFPISFVSTSNVYGSKLMRGLMNKLMAVPRQRHRNDPASTRTIIRLINEGVPVGLFPEGERNWTGDTSKLKPETIRLMMKYRDVPVLPIRLRGNYNIWPRWSDSVRSGKLEIDIREPFKINPNWSVVQTEEFFRRKILPRDLGNPDFRCRGKHIAKGCERVLYRCPVCSTFDSIKFVAKTSLSCGKCETVFTLSHNYELIYPIHKEVNISLLKDVYRRIKIKEEDFRQKSESEFLFRSDPCKFGFRNNDEMDVVHSVKLSLTSESLIIAEKESDLILKTIPLETISSLTTETNKKLHVFAQRSLAFYEIIFDRESVLKWQDILIVALKKYHGKTVLTR